MRFRMMMNDVLTALRIEPNFEKDPLGSCVFGFPDDRPPNGEISCIMIDPLE